MSEVGNDIVDKCIVRLHKHYYLAKKYIDKIQYSSINAINVYEMRFLLCVISLGINYSFHTPWHAIVKQL